MQRTRAAAFECPCHECRRMAGVRTAATAQARARAGVWCAAKKLPQVGYFSEADPTAEVPPARRKPLDPSDRGGRFDPEFIWNTGWEQEPEEADRSTEEGDQDQKQADSGFLSFSRLADLNSLSNDWSSKIKESGKRDKQRKKAMAEAKAAAEAAAASEAAAPGPVIFPTKRESEAWGRSTKIAYQTAERPPTNPASYEEYESEKTAVVLWTLALTAFGFGSTYYFYTTDIAASYLTGAIGGLLYLRLLGRGVDAIGKEGDGPGGILAQPRLLVPVVLVMVYNRWNTLAATNVGVSLELLPMLVGFFTYKGAMVGKQSLQLFSNLVAEVKGEGKREGTQQD
ncbi:unnamed protein product [Ostreobium quekettii]|uniref:CGL160/ATPI domain-containing protein n=1 Tax=Ostreobium quekettii TaxID=121088 RepID=A0A8S1JCF7_9CHLO|nr:unnamed protein product [Ostreobium quekettii]|eukprot:evm.model.scf_649.3 EVM.evm.TU.scf_649.3   scf_649:18631-25886(-)